MKKSSQIATSYTLKFSHRELQIALLIFGLFAIVIGLIWGNQYPTVPNDPDNINLTGYDSIDFLLFELLKLLGGAALVAGTVGVLQEKIEREKEDLTLIGRGLLQSGMRRVYFSGESREFMQRIDDLIERAQYEIIAIGLGNSYLAHSDRLLRSIRERAIHRTSLQVQILFADPRSPALRERIREETVGKAVAKHFVERGWEFTFFDKVFEELKTNVEISTAERVRVERLPFFVMSAILRIDDIAFIQPYGTPNQPGGKCPWIEVDMRNSEGSLSAFIDTYIRASSRELSCTHRRLLLLIRHGQSAHNKAQRVSGCNSNPALTSEGEQQMQELRDRLAARNIVIDFFAVGTHQRSMSSAAILDDGHMTPMFLSKKFNERNLGPYEGLSYEDLREKRGMQNADLTLLTTQWDGCEGVESDAQVLDRLRMGISVLPQQGTVAIITSANVIHVFMRSLGNTATKFPTGEAIAISQNADGLFVVIETI